MKRYLSSKALRRMAGVTLIEIMFVLAIMVVIIIVAIRYYQSTQANQRAQQAVQDMNMILGAVSNYTAGGSGSNTTQSSGSLGVAALKNSGFIPKTLTNPWGGGYGVSWAAPTANAGGNVTITITTDPAGSTLGTSSNGYSAPCTGVQGMVSGQVDTTLSTGCTYVYPTSPTAGSVTPPAS